MKEISVRTFTTQYINAQEFRNAVINEFVADLLAGGAEEEFAKNIVEAANQIIMEEDDEDEIWYEYRVRWMSEYEPVDASDYLDHMYCILAQEPFYVDANIRGAKNFTDFARAEAKVASWIKSIDHGVDN